jgi:hypothetical protein
MKSPNILRCLALITGLSIMSLGSTIHAGGRWERVPDTGKWEPGWGLAVGTPYYVAAYGNLSFLSDREHPDHAKAFRRAGLTAELRLGLAGGTIGFGRKMDQGELYSSIRLNYLRTWGDAWTTNGNRDFVGVEGRIMTLMILPEIGVYKGISGPRDWLVTVGIPLEF